MSKHVYGKPNRAKVDQAYGVNRNQTGAKAPKAGTSEFGKVKVKHLVWALGCANLRIKAKQTPTAKGDGV